MSDSDIKIGPDAGRWSRLLIAIALMATCIAGMPLAWAEGTVDATSGAGTASGAADRKSVV